MALPGIKQKCYICLDDVTEAQYRRELTCSYTSCPGSDHAYHEECINAYLKKMKLPVDRLIGYPCPVVLDNGRPCTGCITRTHHKVPLNQKKKQKRVEAAAAAAVALKTKQPASKPKPAVTGVAVAKAAMRPAGEGVSRPAGIPIVKSNIQPQAIGMGPAARLSGMALAVQKNTTMAPERVVRQAIIPGWTDPKEAAKANLEQQRARAAALKAEARSAAGRGSKAAVGAATGGTGFTAATSAGSGGSAANGKPSTGPRVKPPSSPLPRARRTSEEDVGFESDGSGPDPFVRYLGDTDGSYDGRTSSDDDFSLAPEDFPAIPATGSTSATSTPAKSAAAGSSAALVDMDRRDTSSVPAGGLVTLAGESGAPTLPCTLSAPAGPAASASASDTDAVAAAHDDTDPIVGHDQLYPTEDGALLVMDAYGNYVPMTDVYDESAEMIGYQDDSGYVTYYVIVRKSHVDAQMARMAQQGKMLLATVGSDGLEGATAAHAGGAYADNLAPAGPASVPELPEPVAVVVAPMPSSATCVYESAVAGLDNVQPAGVPPVPSAVDLHNQVGLPAAVAEYAELASAGGIGVGIGANAHGGAEDGAELEDILALCTAAPATGALTPAPAYTFGSMQQMAAAHRNGFDAQGTMPQPGPTWAANGVADIMRDDAEDVDSLMQLLCI